MVWDCETLSHTLPNVGSTGHQKFNMDPQRNDLEKVFPFEHHTTMVPTLASSLECVITRTKKHPIFHLTNYTTVEPHTFTHNFAQSVVHQPTKIAVEQDKQTKPVEQVSWHAQSYAESLPFERFHDLKVLCF